MKILIGVNVLESVNSFVYSSHIKFFTEIKKTYPNVEILFFTPYRMSIDNMRNMAAKIALDNNCDYLMFIDDDVIIQPDTFAKLYECHKDIIMALTFVRGYPFPPMFFKTQEVIVDGNGKRSEHLTFFDDYKDHIEDDLVKCQAVGFSCVLINMDIVKALAPPYFVTGPNHTEDVYFCLKARYSLEPEPSIYCHLGVPTKHIMMADCVGEDNVKQLRELYAPDEPIGLSRNERIQKVVKQLT